MGRKKIRRLVEIIINIDDKIVKIPLNCEFKQDLLKTSEKEIEKPNSVEQTEPKKNDAEKEQEIPNINLNLDQFPSESLENPSDDDEYELFFKELNDIYFQMF